MTGQALYDLLTDHDIHGDKIFILDEEYSQWDKKFLLTEFGSNFERLKGSMVRNVYTTNLNDCDKFALLAHWYAQYLNAEFNKDEKGIAFGTFSYRQDNGGYHQINVIVASDKVYFFEPQNSTFPTLSQSEIESCVNLSI